MARRPGGRGGPGTSTNRLHQRAGLGRRVEIVLQRESPGKLLVDPKRAGTIAGAIQHLQQVAERILVVRRELEAAPSPAASLPVVPGLLCRIRQLPGRGCRSIPQPGPFAVEPVLESGCTGDGTPPASRPDRTPMRGPV